MKYLAKSKLTTATIASSIALLATAPIVAAADYPGFTDVKETDSHYEGIKAIVEAGIASGYADGSFKQTASVERHHAALMLYNALNLTAPNNLNALDQYTDVNANTPYAKEIAAVTEAGFFKGYNGKFNPNGNITREQMATVLVRAFGLNHYVAAEKQIELANVSRSHTNQVQVLADLGVTTQTNDFRPAESVTRGQFATLLHTTFNAMESFEKGLNLSVLYQNDTHANLDDMPKTVTAVKEARAAKPDSLLLHAGDVFSGTLYFNEFEGEADLAMMNLMGFDAWTLGNHEFDLGSNADGHQALADFIQGANFPTVSSNVDFTGDDKFTGLFSDTVSSDPENGKIYSGIVKEIDGEKVGIFGLTTAETADIASPGEITFEDYLEEAEKAVNAFEGMGVNKVIAITHIGFDDNANVDNDQILAASVAGIDIIVGGHTHTQLDEPVVVTEDSNGAKKDPTLIVQSGEYNNNLGTLDVNFDKNGVIVGHAGELIKIGDQEPDAEAAEILKPYKERVEEVSNDEIGVTLEKALENPRTSGDDTQPSVRKNETILGNIITDGMLLKAKEYNENVVIAFQNGGGIRSEIDAGPITVGEVITVLPFGNTLATMDLTGAEIKAAFEHSLKEYPTESGGFLHLAGGKLVFDSAKPVGERIVSFGYYDENNELTDFEDNQTYTIATNAFTAKGGDGYDMLAAAYADNRATELGLSDWENFLEQLVELGSEGIPTEVEGRIVEGEAEEVQADFELAIMHTNDVHAHVEAAPQLATAVKGIRAEKPSALLLDAGDVFQGTLYFTEYQGKADLALMNYLEYDVMTLGNHEFDLGKTAEGHKALKEFVEKATFPIVTANVDFSQDALLAGLHKDEISSEAVAGNIYDGLVMEVDGEEIGIFGLTTETTAGSSSPEAVKFTNYITEAEAAVENLEAQGVDKIIALTHLGYNSPVDNNDILLAENVAGIDVIVGGHSHTTLSEPIEITEDANGDAKDLTLIVQTGSNGANLGTLDVEFDENGVIIGHAGELISLSGLEADEGAAEILAPFTKGIEEVQNEQTGGVALNDLPNPRTGDVGNTDGLSVRNSETALGNLITDGMLSEGKKVEPKATIALQNGGGIRTNVDTGPITMGKVLEVLSFNNGLYSAELTGTELMRALESGVSGVAAPTEDPKEGGSFLHNAGLKVTFDSTKEPGARIESVQVADENGNYAPLEAEKSYTLVTNIYIALGNGYDNVFAEANADGRVHDIGLSDWESFANYLGEAGEVDPTIEGRVLDLARQ